MELSVLHCLKYVDTITCVTSFALHRWKKCCKNCMYPKKQGSCFVAKFSFFIILSDQSMPQDLKFTNTLLFITHYFLVKNIILLFLRLLTPLIGCGSFVNLEVILCSGYIPDNQQASKIEWDCLKSANFISSYIIGITW